MTYVVYDSYLAELFRQIVCYLAELFRQIAYKNKNINNIKTTKHQENY